MVGFEVGHPIPKLRHQEMSFGRQFVKARIRGHLRNSARFVAFCPNGIRRLKRCRAPCQFACNWRLPLCIHGGDEQGFTRSGQR